MPEEVSAGWPESGLKTVRWRFETKVQLISIRCQPLALEPAPSAVSDSSPG